MELLKRVPQSTINKVRYSSNNSGLMFQKYGKHYEIKDYSNQEIGEMIHGIYKDAKMILVDGDYFIDLNDVVEAICVLEDATYYKQPTIKDYKTNSNNSIKNIRTFYVKDYFLITRQAIACNTKHKISNFLCKIGAIRRGNYNYRNMFCIPNHEQELQSFGNEQYPKDLFYPIKLYINHLFFLDDYAISNFKVESEFKIEI